MRIENKLLRALLDLLEDSPFISDVNSCECGENGTGFDDEGNPCVHIRARRAIASVREEHS